MTVARNKVAVSGTKRSNEQAVFHRSRIDEQILLISHASVERRQADHPREPEGFPRAVDPDAVPVKLMGQEFRNPCWCYSRLKGEDPAAVVLEREADIASRHRKSFHGVEAGSIFSARRPQEFAPRGHFVEQPLDANLGSGRKGRGPFCGALAVIDLDSPAVRTTYPAFERQPRYACDRG